MCKRNPPDLKKKKKKKKAAAWGCIRVTPQRKIKPA